MITDIYSILWLATSFLALFGVSELIHRFSATKVELTRKLVHFGTGILTLMFPIFLTSSWSVLFLCASFAVILLVSLRYSLLPSINAIDRKSHGSILYPVAVYSCFLLYDYLEKDLMLFYAPILLLAICDPIAALFGKRWPLGKYRIGSDNKTMMGSSAFLISALIVLIGLAVIFNEELSFKLIYELLLTALIAAIAEALSGKGTDNLTIPLSSLGMLSLFASL